MTDAFGEVIDSRSQALRVECHRLYCAPAFGSFVRADCIDGVSHFAVVTQISTEPVDGNRVVQAYGLPPGELEERKPHLPTLFRTVFEARSVGYRQGEAFVGGTPPLPARPHCYVFPAESAEIQKITGSPAFLRALSQTQDAPLEDLLVCAIEAAREAWGAAAPVVSWGKYLARLLRGDYVTLEGVFQRLSQGGPSALSPVPPAARHPRWEERRPLITGNGPSARVPLGDRDPFQEN
jgi:hypothetical protein